MASRQTDLDSGADGNVAGADDPGESHPAEEGAFTEEQAYYEAQKQGFASLRTRMQSRRRRKP
jgi:hypothetical protein